MSLRVFTKDDYNAADLLQGGLDHIKAAELLLRQSPEVFDSAGYLAHMGFELMLKSWMLHSTGSFKGIHSLEALIKDMQENKLQISLTEKEQQTLAYLKSFEELRYPTIRNRNSVEIGSEDIDQIYELADAIWQQMPEKLIEEHEHIPPGKKCGRVFMKRSKNIKRDLKFETGISSE